MLDNSILDAISKSFASSVQTIYVPSLGKTCAFREPNVKEQRAVSKIVSANLNNASVVYATTLAFIKTLSVDSDFDICRLTEYDRLCIIANLMSNNFFSKKLTINCPSPNCGHKFQYSVNHGDIIKGFEGIDNSDFIFTNSTSIADIEVTCNFQTVVKQMSFLEELDNSAARKNMSKIEKTNDEYDKMNHAFDDLERLQNAQSENGGKAVNNNDVAIANMIAKKNAEFKNKVKNGTENISSVAKKLSNVKKNLNVNLGVVDYNYQDHPDVYIKNIKYKVKGSADDIIVHLEGYDFLESEKIIERFPSSLFIREDGVSLNDFISHEMSDRMQKSIPKITCPKCGFDISSKIKVHDFFIYG